MRSLLLSTLVLGALSLACQAGTITYSGTGSYSSTTPSSWFTAPNQSFEIRFTIDENPALMSPAGGKSFWPALTDFHYLLNGTDFHVTESALYFYTASLGGLFSVSFNPTVNPNGYGALFYFAGDQMFSGAPASPTMLTGTFHGEPGDSNWLYINGQYAGTGPTIDVTSGTPGAVPEPSSWILMATPLAALLLRLRSRKA